MAEGTLEGGPQQLKFRVSECTGEDSEHPASELLVHTQHTRGWHTPRFSTYPQSVTLALEQAAHLQQIQLLAHEYKIPSKVELYVQTQSSASRRLGHLSFATNEESSFKARELRSVPVDILHALSLTIVAHSNHVNHLNLYNQIALVAVNLIGEPSAPGAPEAAMQPHPYQQAQLQLHHNMQQQQQQQVMGAGSAVVNKSRLQNADVGLDTQVDERTARQIRQLQEQKARAVQEEDYDEAKRLKLAVLRLKEAGTKLLQLERSKLEAVEVEDYDEAKRLKLEIDRLRSSAEAAMHSPQQQQREQQQQQQLRLHQQQQQPQYQQRQPAAHVPGKEAPPQPQESDERQPQQLQQQEQAGPPPRAAEAAAAGPAPNFVPEQPEQAHATATPAKPAAHESVLEHDEKPAVGSAAQEEYTAPTKFRGSGSAASANGEQPAPSQPRVAAYPEPPLEEITGASTSSADGNVNRKSEDPEELSSEAEKDYGGIIPLAGEHEARCLASKSWELREAAARRLTERVEQKDVLGTDLREAVRAIGKALGRSLKDRVPAAFMSASLLAISTGSLSASVGQREARESLNDAVATLSERIGDSNSRIRESASNALIKLAAEQAIGPSAPAHFMLRVPKSMQQHKLAIGRLQCSRALLKEHGFGEGITLASYMNFAVKMLESSSGDVRGEAIGAIQDAQGKAGKQPVNKYLPSNLKPQIKNAINGERQDRGPAAGASTSQEQTNHLPQPQQQQQQQQQQQRRQHKEQRSPDKEQQEAEAKGGAGADGNALEQEGNRVGIDELRKEVQAREKQLGKNHQDVAAALVELAGALSEEERFADAQEQYERALAIQEQALGPSHPDTVQTVTDVAICYLDQGKNDQGRPLLERALKDQEHQLGPDHEDVQAIRDVISNLDEEQKAG